jgi:hypothetical protein
MHFGVAFAAKPYGRKTPPRVDETFEELPAEPLSYRSKITYSDADYFNSSNRDARIAKASTPRPTPSLEQIRRVVAAMPAKTELERRDRALIAFTSYRAHATAPSHR